MMNDLDHVPDAPVDDIPPTPLEAEESLAASHAEAAMTRALSALKHRGQRVVESGQRVVETVEHAITPRRVAIGVSLAIGVGALLIFAASRRGRRRRPRTIGGAIARSLAQEVVSRLVLGAAATVGARLAEAAVPMLVAAISQRQAKSSSRTRRSKRALIEE